MWLLQVSFSQLGIVILVVDWLSDWDILSVDLRVSSWVHFDDDSSVLGLWSADLWNSLDLEGLWDKDLLSGLLGLLLDGNSNDDGLLLLRSSSELLLLEDLQLFVSELDVSCWLVLVGDSDDLGDVGLLLEVVGSSLFLAFFAGEDYDTDKEKNEDGSLESSLSELVLETLHVVLVFSVVFISSLVLSLLLELCSVLLLGGAFGGGRVFVFLWLAGFGWLIIRSCEGVRAVGFLRYSGSEEGFRSSNSLGCLILFLLVSLSPSVSVFEDGFGFFRVNWPLGVITKSRLFSLSSTFSATVSSLAVSASLLLVGRGGFRLLGFFIQLGSSWERHS